MENSYCWGTGRRKNALARVRLCPGNGELKINDWRSTSLAWSGRLRSCSR